MLKQKILSIMTVVVVTAVLFSPVRTAQAALIPLNLDNAPTISAGPLDINFESLNLRVTGTPLVFFDGVTQHDVEDGHPIFGVDVIRSFEINASVDSEGDFGAGEITIVGQVPTAGILSTVIIPGLAYDNQLVTGTLTGFGFPETAGDPLEFVFEITGGLASAFFPAGTEFGVILTNTEFPGSFADDWTNMEIGDFLGTPNPISGTGEAIAEMGIPAAIPEPGSLLLIGSGLIGLLGLRRIR